MSEIWEEKIERDLTTTAYSYAGEGSASAPIFSAARKRFRQAGDAQRAVLMLDAGCEIRELTPAARRLLDYDPEQPIQPSFFSHVHAKDLYRVIRDVAEMTCHGRQEASWMLRLRTGQGRWHWFNATVGNQLDQPEEAILIRLEDPLA